MTSDDQGAPDLNALFSQLGQMQRSLEAVQQSAASEVVEGSAGGGAVKVRATGGLDFQAISIDPSVVDPADVDMLQDLVLAAVRDAVERAHNLTTQAMGGLGLPGGIEGLLG